MAGHVGLYLRRPLRNAVAARKPLHTKSTSEHPQQKSKTVPDISSRAESKLDETRHDKIRSHRENLFAFQDRGLYAIQDNFPEFHGKGIFKSGTCPVSKIQAGPILEEKAR